ncbi:MAG: competence/damage-inducible protein A [Negativicutes bacterium]|nr:competence/damage-inducible protein A [Negativicutes bacterium]
MKAEIISTGSELLLGITTNTTADWLACELHDLGLDVGLITMVGDDEPAIREALAGALQRSRLVVTTGGLGPTPSDITKQATAGLLGREMWFDQASADAIRRFFARRGRPMTENNLRQAWFAEGSTVLDNQVGTAPGAVLVTGDGKVVAHLPGPPAECRWMWTNRLQPWLRQRLAPDVVIETRRVLTIGIGEAQLAETLDGILSNNRNPRISLLAGTDGVCIRLTAHAAGENQARQMLQQACADIAARVGRYVYSWRGQDLPSMIGELLVQRNWRLAVAESCTGGKLAARLVDVVGASQWLAGGVVCYSDQVKHNLLSVPERTLSEYGAVSRQTAVAMAEGAWRKLGTELAVAATGIAGPGGGSIDKPVGLVYIAVAGCQIRPAWQELRLTGSREQIRNATVLAALDLIRRELQKQHDEGDE